MSNKHRNRIGFNRNSRRSQAGAAPWKQNEWHTSTRFLVGAAVGSTLLMAALLIWVVAEIMGSSRPAGRGEDTTRVTSIDATEDGASRANYADANRGLPKDEADLDGQATSVKSQEEVVRLPEKPRSMDTANAQARLLDAIERSLGRFPADPDIVYIAGLTYAEIRKTQRAIELFNKTIELANARPEVVVALAELHLDNGDPEKVIDFLGSADAGLLETPEAVAALAKAHLQQGEAEESKQVLERFQDHFSNSVEIALQRSQTYLQLGQFQKAEKEARHVLELGMETREAYLALSNALLRQGKQEEAIAVRRKLPPVEPRSHPGEKKYQESFRQFSSHTYTMLASAYLRHGVVDQAEQYFREAIALQPNSVKSLVGLGDLWQRQGQLVDAIAVYDKLVHLQPETLTHYSNLASLAVRVQKLQLAEQTLEKATRVDPSGNADLLLSQFQIGIGNTTAAAKAARRAIEKSPSVDAYLALITALQYSGKHAEAVKELMRARKLAPDDTRLSNFSM